MPFGALLQKMSERYNGLNALYGDGRKINTTGPSTVDIKQSMFSIIRLLYPPGGNAAYYDCYKGQINYEGQLQPYVNVLEIGSRIGIGQLTPAGLGRFTIEE